MLRRAVLATLAVGLLPILLVGCGDDPTPPPSGTGAISGEVTVNSMPRSGVNVVLDSDRETTTDGLGRFEFDEVETGVHTVAVVPPEGVTCPETEKSPGVSTDETTFVTFECTSEGGGETP